MAPKSAMYHCYGPDAVYDTFQMSNASPQLGELNNGPWGDLEDLVRDKYSKAFGEIWVIAGPIFDDANGKAYLTKEPGCSSFKQRAVEIPDAFYKIVIDEFGDEIRVLAFIIDRSEEYGYGEGNSIPERLSGFLVSVDEIEDRTGLDFIWELDDTAEAEFERTVIQQMW